MGAVTVADEPDLAILLAAAYRALTERLAEAMDKRHIDGMRPSFGFVIRAVAAEEPTITRLAEMLGVTKQSASALADEAERAGFVERAAVAGDRRSRHLRLTAKGRKSAPPRSRRAVSSNANSKRRSGRTPSPASARDYSRS